MAKTKRKPFLTPLPDNCWIGSGFFPTAEAFEDDLMAHLVRLRDKGAVHHVEVVCEGLVPGGGYTAYATYPVRDSTHPVRDGGGDVLAEVTADIHVEADDWDRLSLCPVRWTVVASADRPWEDDWLPPPAVLFPDLDNLPWDRLLLGSGREVTMASRRRPVPWRIDGRELLPQTRKFLRTLRRLQDVTTVISHQDPQGRTPLLRMSGIPPRALTTVLHLTVPTDDGGTTRQVANMALRDAGVCIPEGGALVLPHQPPRPGARGVDLAITRADITGGADPAHALTSRLAQYLALPAWVPPAHVPWVERICQLAQENALERQTNTPEEKDALLQNLTEEYNHLQDLRTQDRRKIAELVRELDEHMAACPNTADSVNAVAEARQQAADAVADRDEAWEQLDDATAQAEDLARRLSWARQQLAEATGTHDLPEERPELRIESWDELTKAAQPLRFVRLADHALEPAAALAGNVSEKVWLRRTWAALLALETYAGLKQAARDAGQLPGPQLASFALYLKSPEATAVIPSTWHAPGESAFVRTNGRLSRTRRFPVPATVDPAGEAFMGEHIRIGSGTPPAPRMHFLDRTDNDGFLYIGYVGPHLPNTQTN